MIEYPIRVLCVFSTLDRGGAESMCMNLYRHIDRSRVQFDFVKHTTKTGAFEKEILDFGGHIYIAPKMTMNRLIGYMAWWKMHFKNHPEHQIVHGHYFTASAIYFRIAKQYNRVTIGHMHIAKYSTRIKKLICSRVEHYSDYCLACGWDAGKLLYPHRHFIVLNNAINAQEFQYNDDVRCKYREQLGLKDDIVIGIVANFGKHKNPLGVIELFNQLVKMDPRYKLLWVGAGGELLDKVKALVDKYNIQKNVILLGVRSDVSNLLQTMDAFILPSFYEGLPVVLIEAQAAGLYCFVSDCVTKEVDITGRCTFLPLDQWEKWRLSISETNLQHVDTYQQIVDSGYDISYTAAMIQDMYITIAKNTSWYREKHRY